MSKITDMTHLSTEIPVIDLSLLSNEKIEELYRLDQACKDWGFFQVINHRVPKEVMQNMKECARGFEEKNKFLTTADDIQGYGHAYVWFLKSRSWTTLILITLPSKLRRLQFWPTTPKEVKGNY